MSPRPRAIALAAHRYVGLVLTVFLVVAGTTGAVLAFRDEADALVNPELFHAHPASPDTPLLEPLALRAMVEAQLPAGAHVTYAPLRVKPHEAASFDVNSTPENPQVDAEYFVNPYTGSVLGTRRWGEIQQGRRNVIPFLYRLHYSLALGEVGTTLFGVVALLWTVDCFVGAYLTLPPRRARRSGPSWLARWRSSWLLNTSKSFSLIFTWHRASGLWLWGMLLVFAWSAVGMNLTELYRPLMNAAFGMEESVYSRLPVLDEPLTAPRVSWNEAAARGRELMHHQAETRGFTVREERTLAYFPAKGMYQYRVLSSLDISAMYPSTVVWVDGHSGQLTAFQPPLGRTTGSVITSWINHLHYGSIEVGGLAYRVFVSALGVMVVVLSVTGVVVWWRKRTKRRARRDRAKASDGPAPSDSSATIHT